MSQGRRKSATADTLAAGEAASIITADTLAAISVGGNSTQSAIRTESRSSDIDLESDREDQRSLPAALLARYEDLQLIGKGGMGRVFRGRDPRLGRSVAIKLLRSDHPEATRRFLHEARAQARVQHDNVCRVYEAGEADGEPYIAMEFIDGQELDSARAAMSLEQKVKVIREVAAALHEAHRLGLIHRDIKPGNIIVATTESGALKPYVVDFGLAHDLALEGQSENKGGIDGTPSYMSPEQAVGAPLDRRSDVYSLGSTLFDLIAGRPPYVGVNIVDILTQVTKEIPPALSSVRPGVPKDLETVVMTCLQKDPSQRYDSARALGEDLQRFLDGDPIQSRRTSIRYVLWAKAKKNKALVSVAGAGLSVALVLGGMWVKAARQASEQARLGRELGEDVKYVELFLRSAYGFPAHDIERETKVVRTRFADIQRRMSDSGRAGQGPGQYALGRGHWALHEYEAAQRHLEQALAAGYNRPEVHVALGLTLGQRYQKALADARRIEDKSTREAVVRRAETTYREPALRHLRESGGTEVESQAYIEGLVALYEKRYADAASKASAAWSDAPWLYEAKALEGDARFAAGVAAKDSGRKEEARAQLNLAISAFNAATAMATSDASIHESLAEAWLQILDLDVWDGRPYRESLEPLVAACDAAITSNPRSANAHSKKARAYFLVSEVQRRSGQDPSSILDMSIQSSLAARKLDPQDAIALDSIGNCYIGIAQYAIKKGQDPLPVLKQALTAIDEAVRIQPNFAWAWNDAGNAMLYQAMYEADFGMDVRSTVEIGVQRLLRAAKEDPTYIGAYTNAMNILAVRETYDLAHGRDPRLDVKLALERAAHAARLDPKWLPLLNNRGWNELAEAQYLDATQADPAAVLDRTEASFAASLDINKDEADTHFGMGSAKYTRALSLIRKGEDPQKILSEARGELTRATEIDAQEPAIRVALSRLLMTMARRAAPRDPALTLLIDEASKVLTEGLRVNPRHAALHTAKAELHILIAEGARTAKADSEIAQGLQEAEKALAINPTLALAHAAKGALYALRANRRADAAARDEDRRAAIDSLEKALAINPLLPQNLKGVLLAMRSAQAAGN